MMLQEISPQSLSPPAVPCPAPSRPRFFKGPQSADQQRSKELRLLLNKITPKNGEEQTQLLLALAFSEPLLDTLSGLIMSKVSSQKVLSPTFAQMCIALYQHLSDPLGRYFQGKLNSDLLRTITAVETPPEALYGLLSLDSWLIVQGLNPPAAAFSSSVTVMDSANSSEDTLSAVCSVFKSTVSEIVLLHESVRTQCDAVISRFSALLVDGHCSKKMQFQLEDIVHARDSLLHPPAKVVKIDRPPVQRKKLSKHKRVQFPEVLEIAPNGGSEDTTESEGSDSRRNSHTRLEPISIIRTRLTPAQKVGGMQGKTQGVMRKLFESHDMEEASRDLEELLKSIDLPALTEALMQVIKFTLLIMSKNEHMEMCALVSRVLQALPEILYLNDLHIA